MSEGNLPQPPMFGIGKLNFGGGMALKPRAVPEKIIDYKIDKFTNHRGKNATERLRELDKLHMHTPLPDEVELLNVTPYRMNLLATQDVMYLCGGLVGVRFSSEELTHLIRLTKGMSSAWNEVSASFQHMTTSCKKLALPVDSTIEVADQDSEDTKLVKNLHQAADNYVDLFAELQEFIKLKQLGVDTTTRTDAPMLEADPESKMGRSLPEWLSTLIEKHQSSLPTPAPVVTAASSALPPPPGPDRANGASGETEGGSCQQHHQVAPDLHPDVSAPWPHPHAAHPAASSQVGGGAGISVGAGDTAAAKTKAPIRTSQLKVGELSVFLSGCVTGMYPCSSESEQEAMALLVQASNDTVISLSNSELSAASGSPGTGAREVRSRRYWAKRFYDFLSKLTELATAIKDEGALDAI